MKISRWLLLVLCILASALWLRAEPIPSSADTDYAAFEALTARVPAGDSQDIGWEKYLLQRDAYLQAMQAAAWGFYAAHPADPRRWEVPMRRLYFPPLFIKGFAPDVATKGEEAIIRDEVAAAALRRQYAAFMQALLASTDAPLNLRERAEWDGFSRELRAAVAAKARGEPYDCSEFGLRFDAHLAKWTQIKNIINRAIEYTRAMDSILSGNTLELWRHLKNAPHAEVRDMAEEKVAFLELTSTPIDIAFTAVDGRAVDLKAMRGKVVLVDFWATWCEPCREEIPNVVANYKKYRDRGFEVVGITLENARLGSVDTAEQTAAKLANARKVLINFTATHDMPWPQYFDGRLKQNEIAVKYFVKFIPTMFLLDQKGMVVSTDARGEKLEAEIKRLLKL